MTMTTDKVTRDDLRAIRQGESRRFVLPSYEAVLSAKTNAYSLGRIMGCRYVCAVEPDENVITITRMPR